MKDYRQVIVALVLAILITFFVQTSIEAVVREPLYQDFCGDLWMRPSPLEQVDRASLTDEQRAELEALNEQRRVEEQECSRAFSQARDRYRFSVFLISSGAGLIAVLVGIVLPSSSAIGVALASGILLGGLLSLFIGTIRGWSGIGVMARPLVLLLEIIIVIVVAYWKMRPTQRKRR